MALAPVPFPVVTEIGPVVALSGTVAWMLVSESTVKVVAFVVLNGGAEITPEDLIAWSRQRIGGYKYPREIHVMDALPLTAVGKIDRKSLRTMR